MPDEKPSSKTSFDVIVDELWMGHREWKLALVAAIFLAFATSIVRLDQYSDNIFRFERGYGWLSLLGLWLVCFWGVSLARKFWKPQ